MWQGLATTVVTLAVAGARAHAQGAQSPSLPTLTSAEQIRELTHDQANRGYPVRLRAVVTYNDPTVLDYFVQDSTAGIYVNDLNGHFRFSPGQLLEITGVTEEPDFAPQIGKPHYRELGRAPLPVPHEPTFEGLASTRYDSQWVEFSGVVRDAVKENNHLSLHVRGRGGELPVYVLTADGLDPATLVDAEVRISGVCATIYNSKNQLIGVRLITADARHISVNEPAPADPFNIPLRPLGGVLSFAAQGASEHRIRVRGTVTLQRPRGVFIQDGQQGLYIPGAGTAPVKQGDRVEVAGFADVGDYTPVLRDALFRKTGASPLPPPATVTAREAESGKFDTLRVTLEGTLRDFRRNGDDRILLIQSGDVLFEGRVTEQQAPKSWRLLVPGSRLRLTGVCSVEVDRARVPDGFAMLLNSPADIVVLSRPSWWTLRKAVFGLALLAALTLTMLGWAGSLRRLVGQQTETIRRKLENETALERRFQHVARATNDVVWDWDLVAQTMWWSDNLTSAFQYAPGEVRPEARWRFERLHPEDRARVEQSLQSVVASGGGKWSAEYRFRRAGGEYAYVFDRGYLVYDAAGTPVRMIGALMDVTAQKQAEEQLAQERNLLRTLIDNLPDLIYVRDLKSRFLVANKALARLVGASRPEDLLGKSNFELFPEVLAQSYYADDQRVMETGQALVGREEKVAGAEGRAGWILTTKVPLRGPRGEVVGLVGVGHDITSRKQAEEAIERARAAAEAASRAKSDFLANMSHEIRTPMNGILGMTELALETDLGSEQRQYLEAVKTSAVALLTVINDILDFSKVEAGKMELSPIQFNLWSSLEETARAVAPQAHGKGLELVCDIDNRVPEIVVGDPTRLRQIVTNLLGNAVKFTERGEVVLEVHPDEQSGEGPALHFVVRDTGIGISSAKCRQIFDPFEQADSSTTRRFGGTGLGLTISERLVHLMGGRIWVESEEGRGSRFHFTAHFGAAPEMQNGDNSASQAASLAGARVLLVERNPASRRALRGALTGWGIDVEEAEDDASALTALRTARAADRPFRLVIADAQAPGEGGWALLDRIARDPDLRQATVLMHTTSSPRRDAAGCRALGAAACLTKPVARSELREAILHALECGSTRLPAIPAVTPAAPEWPRKGRILVAEDNAVNRILALRLLEKHGHSVAVATHGREALAALEAERFDLLLLDLQMPEMDGFELIAAVREREARTGGHLPVIAMTAHALKGDREHCLEMGMDDYVSKPIRVPDLLRAVEGQLAKAPEEMLATAV